MYHRGTRWQQVKPAWGLVCLDAAIPKFAAMFVHLRQLFEDWVQYANAEISSLHCGACQRRTGSQVSRNRNLAKSVSRLRDRYRRPRVYIGLPKNRLAGLW